MTHHISFDIDASESDPLTPRELELLIRELRDLESFAAERGDDGGGG